MRKVLVATLIVALAGTVAVVAAVRHGAERYLSPEFGHQMWTPPARVLHADGALWRLVVDYR